MVPIPKCTNSARGALSTRPQSLTTRAACVLSSAPDGRRAVEEEASCRLLARVRRARRLRERRQPAATNGLLHARRRRGRHHGTRHGEPARRRGATSEATLHVSRAYGTGRAALSAEEGAVSGERKPHFPGHFGDASFCARLRGRGAVSETLPRGRVSRTREGPLSWFGRRPLASPGDHHIGSLLRSRRRGDGGHRLEEEVIQL